MITIIEAKKTIVDEMTNHLIEEGYSVTPDVLLVALKGLQEAWKEDTDVSPEKDVYVTALNMLIVDQTVAAYIHSLKK